LTTSVLNEYPKEIQTQAARILFKLSQLGFGASFVRMDEGPILRTFYFQPSLDALFARVINKEEEIAGTLAVESARLFRDAGLIAIEIPRSDRQLIRFDQCLHKMLESQGDGNLLPVLMGQSPKGDYLIMDLAAQPHLLIAGATGSGKSIFTSQLICSLALFLSPKQLELTLVDTKNLDLVLFKGLEHITEVITDVEILRDRLQLLLAEVRHRTQLMSGIARNLTEWNSMNRDNPLPYKLLIVDELADVMEQDASIRSGMEKEEKTASPAISLLIKQIAQISRAAGVHIIIATQRPSVGMVTGDSRVKFGDIKANFPARICFKLPTMADSRVVLDQNGAEILLGKGDYLYKIAGSDTVNRAHSAFVSMDDIALILSQHEQIRRTYAAA